MTGTQHTIRCNASSGPTCLQTYPGGESVDPFTRDFNLFIGGLNLNEGDNLFNFGNYSGIITNNGGYLTGSNLFYSYYDSGVPLARIGSRYEIGRAGTFNVLGGIPEPGTWLFMLVGFGAVGSAMRRQRRVATAVAA